MTVKKNRFQAQICLTAVLLLLFCPPVSVLGSWGLEVGRADAGDVASLAADWVAFNRARNRIYDALKDDVLPNERQRQLLGLSADDKSNIAQLTEDTQRYWLQHVVAPLQRIAMNPAASCEEARFAVSKVLGMERQRQLAGLGEDATLSNALKATAEMASLRCREEALDECVATGRFAQILDLVMNVERQAQFFGRTGDLESWAEDALKQCALYELHFVSTSKMALPNRVIETVRDGKVAIRFELPAGGIKGAVGAKLGEVLKGKTDGGNNPFFVSVKCNDTWPVAEIVCSPGADSSPIEVRINALDLKHREFYIESEVSKERKVGEDKFTFDFAGGTFSLQAVVKFTNGDTETESYPFAGNLFYIAHSKDAVDGYSSSAVKVKSTTRGVYPVMFHFTYADKNLTLASDSTEFELIHKPKPKPFPQREREPNRRPLIRRPGE